jgi:hypothetical protein
MTRATVRRLLQLLGTATASVGVVAVAAALMSLSDTSPPTPLAAPTAVPYRSGPPHAERRAAVHDSAPIGQAARRPAPSDVPLAMSAPVAVTPITAVRASVAKLPSVVVAEAAPVMEVASLQEALPSLPATPEVWPAAVPATNRVCRRSAQPDAKHGRGRDRRAERKQNHQHTRTDKRGAEDSIRASQGQHRHARTGCTARDRNGRQPISTLTATAEDALRRSPRDNRPDGHHVTRCGPAVRPASEQPRRRTAGTRHPLIAKPATHRLHTGP